MTREDRFVWVDRLEAMGVRRVSDAMSRAFGDDPLPPNRATIDHHGWSADRLRTTSDTARYYAWANFLRGLIYVPLLAPLRHAGWVLPFAMCAALITFHAVCVLVELHRLHLLKSLEPSAHPIKPPPKVKVGELPDSWFYEPKRWETTRLYQALGLEQFRQFVREYDRRTRGAEPAMAANLAVMELDSRIAESMHWTAALINVPFTWSLIHAGSPWRALCYAILLGDFYLVLLQRYHRVRIRATANKRNRRPAKNETPTADVRTTTG